MTNILEISLTELSIEKSTCELELERLLNDSTTSIEVVKYNIKNIILRIGKLNSQILVISEYINQINKT